MTFIEEIAAKYEEELESYKELLSWAVKDRNNERILNLNSIVRLLSEFVNDLNRLKEVYTQGERRIIFEDGGKVDDFCYEMLEHLGFHTLLLTNASDIVDLVYAGEEKNKPYFSIGERTFFNFRGSKRDLVLREIENEFQISMSDYPEDDKYLTVWKVAQFVKQKIEDTIKPAFR